MYGWRAKLGILVPSGIVVTEQEFHAVIPEGVSCHYHRIAFQGGGIDNLKKVEAGLADATRLMLHVRPTAMAMAGTGVSFAGGLGYDRAMIQKMQEINGNLPTTTTSSAVIDALHLLGVKKVSMAMPYITEVALAAAKFVVDSGFEVLNKKWLDIKGMIHHIPRETVYGLAREVDEAASDAIFLSCTGWPTLEVIDKLETDLGKPVISSNQATIWRLLRLAGINDKIQGYGQLLSKY